MRRRLANRIRFPRGRRPLRLGLPAQCGGASSAARRAAQPLATLPGQPIDGPALEYISSIGGEISTLALNGSLAYIGQGRTLVIFDLRHPNRPRLLASVPLPEPASAIQVVGYLVFVMIWDSGLFIFDVRRSAQPILRSRYTLPAGIGDFQVIDGLVYLGALGTYNRERLQMEAGGLHVLDIADPAHPIPRGRYRGLPNVTAVEVVGDRAYITGGDTFQILGIQDPAASTLLSSIPVLYAGDMLIVNDLAYVSGRRLQIFDVSEPHKPLLLGSYDLVTPLSWTNVIDSLAYIASPRELQIVDLSNPADPRLCGTYVVSGTAVDVAVVGNRAYIAAGPGGVQVVDIGTPERPLLRAHYLTPGLATGIQVAGDLVYVTDQTGGLQILRIRESGILSEVKS